VATELAREFATVINRRVYSRILTAYSQPSEPAAVTLWQDFLIFVRDYMPRAVVRSVAVDTTTNPATITVEMNVRWSTDAGFDRTRPATFTGVGVAVPSGWQLHRVRLASRFW
jgi:hypothetical protein